jgi:hypothetical protein
MKQISFVHRLLSVRDSNERKTEMAGIIFPAKLAPMARQLRHEASQMPLAQLWKEIEILDQVRTAQLATLGQNTAKYKLAEIAIGDELQKRITGIYPVDCMMFQ